MDRDWRLIMDAAGRAAWNMAVDEALLRACARGAAPPTLRLYGWERPSLSLGYFQHLDRSAIDLKYCRDHDVDLVRRPTGGRAVLHGHDLTFSIALREDDLPEDHRGIRSSHLWLMHGVLGGLRSLGVQAEAGKSEGSESGLTAGADCFAHIADCDLRVGRAKVAGAAQARKDGALLEQGSIPCASPAVEYARIFVGASATQGSELPVLHALPHGILAQAIIRGFEQRLGRKLLPGTLSECEIDSALHLDRHKYSLHEWTNRWDSVRIDNSI